MTVAARETSRPQRWASDRPYGEAIHATAVAICGEGLLILGPARSGKSRLALALLEALTPDVPILLIGDDRILLSERRGGLVARSHPRIAGFVERRDLGIVAVPFAASAPVRGIVALGLKTMPSSRLNNFPRFAIVDACEWAPASLAGVVLGWWRGACTTHCRKRG